MDGLGPQKPVYFWTGKNIWKLKYKLIYLKKRHLLFRCFFLAVKAVNLVFESRQKFWNLKTLKRH